MLLLNLLGNFGLSDAVHAAIVVASRFARVVAAILRPNQRLANIA